MDHERLLISKIIEDKDIAPVLDAGITDEYFLNSTNRRVFKRIQEHKAKYGTVPSLRRIKRDHPRYNFVEVHDEAMGDLIDLTVHQRDLAVLENAITEAAETFDNRDKAELDKAIMSMTATFSNVLKDVQHSASRMKDVNLAENASERWEHYEALRKRTDELLGISSGFPTLDKALQGFQSGQLIVFAGPPKAGKSTMMLLAALAAHKAHKRPLVIGFEMTNEEQTTRVDAITANISHHRLRGGQLTEQERKDLKRRLNSWEDQADFFLSNDTMSVTTLSGVESKIDKYDPDLLIVDGVYMMQDENGEPPGSPQAITNITRGSKRMAQNRDLPVIITTQVLEWKMDKKKGVTSGSIGYSSSFGQDADALIAVQNTEDPKIKLVKVVFARNSAPVEVYVRWDWETGEFTELPGNPFDETEHDEDEEFQGNF